MMLEKEGRHEYTQHLARTEKQRDKLAKLAEDLLDVSKIPAGKLELVKELFDFDELVRETVENVQQTTTTHTITAIGALKQEIHADRDRLGQVLQIFSRSQRGAH